MRYVTGHTQHFKWVLSEPDVIVVGVGVALATDIVAANVAVANVVVSSKLCYVSGHI